MQPKSNLKLKDASVQTEKKDLQSEPLKQKMRILMQKLRRRDFKIQNLLDIIKRKCSNFDEVQTVLKNNFIDINKHINTDKSNKGIRYSAEMKQFALSLYYYSAKAYVFLRNHIALPHPATLRKMLATNECNVGFMSEALEFIKCAVENDDSLRNVALIFDAMAIRSQITYDKNSDKHWGYVDLGGIASADAEVLATEVLVFQIVSLSGRFKCPIGYFFINKISANVQAQLILTAVRLLSDINVIVRSLTCDGTATNVSTYECLNCNFKLPEMCTFFKHPSRDIKIYCLFDPPHMLKLSRNVFAETELTSDNGPIQFKYVKELHKIQEEEGLRLANKLCGAHVNFFNKKMSVKLAAQVLSSSVADAIDFMRQSGNSLFAGSEATVEYIRILDRIFDLMNCKDPFGKGFKSALRLENKDVWMNVLKETKAYLLTLKVNGKNILEHRRKTPVLGFIVNITSFENLAMDLLQSDEFKYFLTYKCSQDHLEMYFSCVRARGGANDNPSAMQFRYIVRKLLYKNSIKPSINANCTTDDYELTPVLEFRNKKRAILEECNKDQSTSIDDLLDLVDNACVSDFKLNVIYYIAGYIVNGMIDKISCSNCREVLLDHKTIDHNYCVDISQFSAFTAFIDRGKLKHVSRFVFEILKYTEKLFITLSNQLLKNVHKNKIIMYVVQEFYSKLHTLFDPPHPPQSIFEDSHDIQLVKSLANSYLNLRLTHNAKLESMKHIMNKLGLRQKLHKTVLFSNV